MARKNLVVYRHPSRMMRTVPPTRKCNRQRSSSTACHQLPSRRKTHRRRAQRGFAPGPGGPRRDHCEHPRPAPSCLVCQRQAEERGQRPESGGRREAEAIGGMVVRGVRCPLMVPPSLETFLGAYRPIIDSLGFLSTRLNLYASIRRSAFYKPPSYNIQRFPPDK